ncbi:coiled-coil domain-containing protein [Butyrivibrio sp. AC2005]|uniref:coiled-coil domain-containing protein n=1 Tax=Butyrivibrio sp. AC2005 TaxID=1280672 RepID=UPI0004077358|nr:hypothetical protein [Butyrivibrio sp. AC2005]
MGNEFEIYKKDYIKLNLYKETIEQKKVEFKLFLEIDNVEKDLFDIRNGSKYRFNNFNVTEDENDNYITFRPITIGCYLYFRLICKVPVKIDIVKNGSSTVAQSYEIPVGETKIEFEPKGLDMCLMKLDISADSSLQGTTISNTQQVNQNTGSFGGGFDMPTPFEGTTPLGSGTGAVSAPVKDEPTVSTTALPGFDLDFAGSGFQAPQIEQPEPSPIHPTSVPVQASNDIASNEVFRTSNIEETREKEQRIDQLNRSNDSLQQNIDALNESIRQLEAKNQQLVDGKKGLEQRLAKLQAEYDKDYSKYEDDLKEISEKYNIDAEILKLYGGQEITPIEELFARTEMDITAIEEQIKIFVEAQQRKTTEIEEELKIGKK